MKTLLEGNALVYCEGAFGNTYGKTAHGLVRFTNRYRIIGIIDSAFASRDAGEILDGVKNGIPVYANLNEAFETSRKKGITPTHLIIGIATDGGVLYDHIIKAAFRAVEMGLNVDSGLHEFLSDIPELKKLASIKGVAIRDVRKLAFIKKPHFFSGKIEKVGSVKIAVLGTDSAVGKRTTAWLIVQALKNEGYTAEMIGTGQTSWFQGAEYSIILDSLINDFIPGEIEHIIWQAWEDKKPQFMVIEGQGSLMNPGYPGGFEILAAGRPNGIVLQHAPARKEYDGFPGYPLHPIKKQIKAIEIISEKPVIGITINHEGIRTQDIPSVCKALENETGLPTVDPILEGCERILESIVKFLKGS